MKQFYKDVDTSNRNEMINFLKNHFRYHTMNSWNNSTSYANNVKIYNLGLTHEQDEKLYELLETDEFYDEIEGFLSYFAQTHDYQYQVGFNGRNSGYLVLYKGGRKPLEYKSRCINCGQLNFTEATEENHRCGKCGKDTRVNLEQPIMRPYTLPGQNIDMGEDFEDWDKYDLARRVKLIQDFDKLCDEILEHVVYLCNEATVEEEETYIPQKVKRMVV